MRKPDSSSLFTWISMRQYEGVSWGRPKTAFKVLPRNTASHICHYSIGAHFLAAINALRLNKLESNETDLKVHQEVFLYKSGQQYSHDGINQALAENEERMPELVHSAPLSLSVLLSNSKKNFQVYIVWLYTKQKKKKSHFSLIITQYNLKRFIVFHLQTLSIIIAQFIKE